MSDRISDNTQAIGNNLSPRPIMRHLLEAAIRQGKAHAENPNEPPPSIFDGAPERDPNRKAGAGTSMDGGSEW